MQALMVNPIGKIFNLDEVTSYTDSVVKKWKEINTGSWWKFWSLDWTKATGFLILSVDELIRIVEKLVQFGPDKKATVLDALGKLFDTIVLTSAPFWLKPILSASKSYIINTLCSMLIDWIVSKYNDGTWRENVENKV